MKDNEGKVVIECLGKDELLHICEPHAEETICGQEIRRKEIKRYDFMKYYSCAECDYSY